MNPPKKTSTTHHIPAWQTEHAATLHKICSWIAARQAKGEDLSVNVRRFSRRWNGKPYRSEPSRRLRLSVKSLFRTYRAWRLGGETPAAVALSYSPPASKIKEAMMRAFLRRLFLPGTRSAVHAFELFNQRRSGARPISYACLMRHLPPNAHQKIRAAQKALTDAEVALARLKLTIEAQALATLPPSRREPDFQI